MANECRLPDLSARRNRMHKSIVALIVIMAIAVASIPTNANARRIGYGWRSAGWMGPGVGLPPWGWRGQGWDGSTFIVRLTTGMAAFGRCFFGLHRLRVWLGNIIRCAERAQESATERALSMGLCVYWLHGARGLEAKAWQLALPPHFS